MAGRETGFVGCSPVVIAPYCKTAKKVPGGPTLRHRPVRLGLFEHTWTGRGLLSELARRWCPSLVAPQSPLAGRGPWQQWFGAQARRNALKRVPTACFGSPCARTKPTRLPPASAWTGPRQSPGPLCPGSIQDPPSGHGLRRGGPRKIGKRCQQCHGTPYFWWQQMVVQYRLHHLLSPKIGCVGKLLAPFPDFFQSHLSANRGQMERPG